MAVAVVFDRVRLEIVPRYIALATLGGVGFTVCGTLNLVRRATGSYLY